jgi:hypothetical protein
LLLFVLPAAGAALGQTPAPAPKKPAILFCLPGENRYGYAGYDYMQNLAKAGYAVDFIEGAAGLTWDKVKNYNVLFVYDFPARGPEAETGIATSFAMQPPWLADYWAVLDKFLKAGGGVFLHYCPFYGGTAPNDLLKEWGVQFPLNWLRDTNAHLLSNMPYSAAYTDQINPQSPVSEGVHGFWYPLDLHYCGAHTMPIIVDNNWQVIARASKTAESVVPTYGRGEGQPPPGALIPAEPLKDPVLFAVRDYPGGGRLAAIQTWFQWSVGSGSKWLYQDEVLSKGLAGKPSDYGKLLMNTYAWLAEPSVKSGALGGAVTDPSRLVEVQLRPGAMEQFHDWNYNEEEVLQYRRPPTNGKLYRGLIGAQTALSGGAGTVADYAAAAVAAKLDFVIFLEDFARMTPEKLETLKADVAQSTTPTLRLFAGYRMRANTGNYMFVCGNNVQWPWDRLLGGPDKRTFNIQFQDEQGKFVYGNPSLDWCLRQPGAELNNNLGFYNFTKSGNGMKMYDLRAYSMAAVRTYEAGKLVEDMTDDYLTTSQSTAVPDPVSVNLVQSPAELTEAVASGQSLTYAQARRLDLVWEDALRWNSPYDAMNCFPSNGPLIEAWPRTFRVMPFGGENFVTGRTLMPAPIRVTSEVGLQEIRLYDGQALFRRFLCHGAKEFETTLFFPGVIMRNIVLVAEDLKGGRADSFAYRQYKEADFGPIFCSDHVNDCGPMMLAHGTLWPQLFRTPVVPDAGGTWDGGPPASRPLLFGQWVPNIQTDKGNYDTALPYQIPLLEFADESGTRCRMIGDRVMAKGIPVSGPWTDFGPTEPAPLVDMWGSHCFLDPYKTGVEPNAYGAPGVREGPFVGLATEQFKFKQDCIVNQFEIFSGGWYNKLAHTLIAFGKGAQIRDVWAMPDTLAEPKRRRIDTGEWFAFYSPQVANTDLFINRGRPLLIQANPDTQLHMYVDVSKTPVKQGETWGVEVFSQVWPLDMPLTDARQLADLVAYFQSPTGLKITRGAQVAGPGGLLELTPTNYAVELSVPKPEGVVRTLPIRVSGFNKRWSVGLYQFEGFRTHYYSQADSGYRALGVDFDGRAYAPLYVSKSANTHILLGHPVVADMAGKDLFIQVTRINDGDDKTPPAWHLSVNNPTDKPVTTTLQRAMDLAGLSFTSQTLTLQPGEYRVLSNGSTPKPK